MFDDETITDPDLSLMYVEAAKVLYGYLSGLQVAMPPAVFRTENGAEVLA
jgi:hypothetical protein